MEDIYGGFLHLELTQSYLNNIPRTQAPRHCVTSKRRGRVGGGGRGGGWRWGGGWDIEEWRI